MGLLQTWRESAYSQNMSQNESDQLWGAYFKIEQDIYKQILANQSEVVEGTVKELADKYSTDIMTMVGFLDGINESLKSENPLEEMTEDTKVSLAYDCEKLYYNMVEAKADWLYELPEWDVLITPEKRKELFRTQKSSGTIVKGAKVGRNDPCPCGSGKKYKKCCSK